jgi:hypothetical protein
MTRRFGLWALSKRLRCGGTERNAVSAGVRDVSARRDRPAHDLARPMIRQTRVTAMRTTKQIGRRLPLELGPDVSVAR